MCFFVAGTGVDNCGLVFLSVGNKYDLKSFLFFARIVSYCYDCSQIVEFNFTVLDGKWSSTKRRRMYEYSILCHFTEIG